MYIPEDPQDRKKWMMDILKEYGRELLIFEPEDRPIVLDPIEPEVFTSLQGDVFNSSEQPPAA